MLELIQQISGPLFLFLYAAIAIATFNFYQWLVKKIDIQFADQFAVNIDINGIEVAVLKYKNTQPVIKAVMVSVFDKKYIEYLEDGTVQASRELKPANLNPIEKIIWDYFQTPQSPRSVIRDGEVRNRVKQQIDSIKEGLKEKGILRGSDRMSKIWMRYLLIFGALFILGFLKLKLGLSNDRPVGFLALLMFIIFFFFMVYLPKQLSTTGEKRLAELANKYKWVQDRSYKGETPSDFDPVMAVGLFGMGSILFFPEYSVFGTDFPEKLETDNYSASGCSSCSSSSNGGSDGGSSDGGGSDGGSGCGGCGGGD